LAKEREVKKSIAGFVTSTSDRGLAGGFNSNIVKLAKAPLRKNFLGRQKQENLLSLPVGKKAFDALQAIEHIRCQWITSSCSNAELSSSICRG